MRPLRHQAAFPLCFSLLAAFLSAPIHAQDKPEAPRPQAQPEAAPNASEPTSSASGPAEISLALAIRLARANSTVYNAALTEASAAHEDRTQARDALLPQVTYNNQYLYTQANELGQVRFIANNAVHEYLSLGNVHESIDVAAVAGYQRANAAAAAARARAEIASRGLVVTVVEAYFAAIAAENKLDAAGRAADEGERFLELTERLEHGGEVAHSDTIKFELQANDRRRQLQESLLHKLNTLLDLAVLLFAIF